MSHRPQAPTSLDHALANPAELADSVMQTGRLPAYAEPHLSVVGWPGHPLREPLRPGDLLLRRALGEGRMAHVGVLVDGSLHSFEELAPRGLGPEQAIPGQFAHVAARDFVSSFMGEGVARFVTDHHGVVPRNQIVLRPYDSGFEVDTARTGFEPIDPDSHFDVELDGFHLEGDFDERDWDENEDGREDADDGFDLRALESAAEATASSFNCRSASAIQLHTDLVTGMLDAWNRSNESPRLAGLCRDTPSGCPTAHQAPHATGDAAHFHRLTRASIRVLELAGLWGLDLSTVRSQSTRASTSVKTRPTASPFQNLSFVGIKSGSSRQLHVARSTPRVVESYVSGARWTNLGWQIVPGTDYHVFKRRYFEASLHRQWGKEAVISWLVGLANFYRDRTGERLGVGDISHIVGEDMTDHGSHERGVDVDIYALEAAPAGSTFPVSHWTTVSGTTVQYRELTPPSATATRPEYGTPASGTAVLAGTRAARVQQLWVTLLAYCAANHGLLDRVVWHGAKRLRSDAEAAAQQAWDDTVAASAGTTTQPGWRASWGPGPATRADISAVASKFLGDGSGSYGPGKGWPPHQDHIHIRFS